MLDGMPQVMWFIRRHMRSHRTRGLSVPQFRTLVLIERFPTASVSCVAENLGVTLPTASRAISGLVARGFVSRESSSDDRRLMSLQLTPQGKDVLDIASGATRDAVAAELAGLSDAQRSVIVDAMGSLSRIFGEPTTAIGKSCAANSVSGRRRARLRDAMAAPATP